METPPSPPASPYEASELRSVFLQPQRALELVLTERERLIETVARRRDLWTVTGVLLYASVVFALPYGAVLGPDRFWRLAALFLGSLLICLPSLQVFSAYVGFRTSGRQSLALGLLITSTASLFSFGFFPILWFLRATMLPDSTLEPGHLSVALILISLGAGLVHLHRCMPRLAGGTAYTVLTLMWQGLLIFIVHRMAGLLGIW